MNRLKNKTAIITGGARGQGAAHAELFVQEGASVVVTDILAEDGRALCEKLGPSALFVQHDVASAESWENVSKAAEAAFGGVDILVNNAAIGDIIAFADLTEDAYRRIININQVSVFLSLKAIVPSMLKRGSGSIVNISSVAGLVASVGNFAYTASKFAIRGMTKSAALEFAAQNIRVNSVHPGAIRTPMFDASGTMDQHVKALIPMRRIAAPEEVSGLVLFLASEESSYCTGAEFVVDGGYTMV